MTYLYVIECVRNTNYESLTNTANYQRADWVDVEETIPEVAAAENVIAQYRSVYDGTHDELYSKMRDLHEAKEAAKLVELYDAHFQKLIQAQETSTGLLGNQTKMREGGEKQALGALREYAEFVNVCESDRVARKIESELGRQVTFLRSQLSIEEFSVHVAPMAVDRIVVRP